MRHLATRWAVIVAVTVVVNLLLFSAMQAMVRQERVRLTEAEDLQIANFIRMSELTPPPDPRRDAEPPSKPRAEEQARINQLVESVGGSFGSTSLGRDLKFDFGAAGGLGQLGGGVPTAVRMASDLVILVRTPPAYPRNALVSGVEGYVDVLFTVTETGTVSNPTVLAAKPAGVFEDVSLAAVARWRFQPVVRNGRPVAIPVRTRLRFTLAEGSG